jgi:hypothetical protein
MACRFAQESGMLPNRWLEYITISVALDRYPVLAGSVPSKLLKSSTRRLRDTGKSGSSPSSRLASTYSSVSDCMVDR